MYIQLKEVAKNLDIQIESIYKVLNRCGYKRTPIITLKDAEVLIKCLKDEKTQYRTKLLISELEKQIVNTQ